MGPAGGSPASFRLDPRAVSDPDTFWRRFRGRSVVIETAYAQTPILRSTGPREPGGTSLDSVLTTRRRIRGVVETVTPSPPGLVLRDSVEEVVFQELGAGSSPPEGEGEVRETRRLPRKFVAFAVMETVDFPEE